MQAVGSDGSSLRLEQARTDQISLRLFFSGIPVQIEMQIHLMRNYSEGFLF